MQIEYTYRFVTGDVITIKIDEADAALLAELDRTTHNSHRKETRRHASLEAYGTDRLAHEAGDDPAAAYERQEALEALMEAIDRLSDAQQALIRKVFFDDVTPAHIARQEGVSKSAITQRLNVIKKILRDFLG
jgi:RNA polymerase sigma factor (sigma-70 family)